MVFPTYSYIGSSCVLVVHCMWYQRHSSVCASVLARIVYQFVYRKKKTAIRSGSVVYVRTPHPSPTPILHFSSFLKEGWGEIGGRRAKGTRGEDDEEEVGDVMGRILSGMGRRKGRVRRGSMGRTGGTDKRRGSWMGGGWDAFRSVERGIGVCLRGW